MNRFFLSALVLAAAISCKTQVAPVDPNINEPSDDLISLSVGSASRAGNQGVRDTLFDAGDQIGVSATNPDDQTTPTAPSWAIVDTCFDNRPALWVNNTPTVNPTFSHFAWGAAGEGGIAHNQYYPGSQKKLYIFAYYPYSTTNYIAPNGTSGPKLKVDLTDGVIDGQATDVNLTQADVLYYISGNPVDPTKPTTFSSAAKMASMNFNHALAQLRFVLKRSAGAQAGKFVKLVFKTAKSATLDLTTGTFTYDPGATYLDATYTITPKTGDVVDIPEDDGTVIPFTGGLDVLNAKPLMILPLTLSDAQKGELVLTVDFSTTNTPDVKEIPVLLPNLTKGLTAGKLNTYNLSVGYHLIELKASITAWDTVNGSENDLDAE